MEKKGGKKERGGGREEEMKGEKETLAEELHARLKFLLADHFLSSFGTNS